MRKSIALFFSLLFCLTLLGGCATMGDVIKAKDEGTSKIYPVNSEQAWMIAKVVFAGREPMR
jgi:hypothetical protein